MTVGAAGRLQAGLHEALVEGRGGLWEEPQAMTPVLERLRQRYGNAAGRLVSADRIAAAMAAFCASGRVTGFVELKHVCLGAAAVAADGSCLLAQALLRDRLLALAETVPTTRRQIKCFQCLLRSFWSFPVLGSETNEAARAGLEVLREWLARRYEELGATRQKKPLWFATLARHANLLGAHPCDRYGPGLLRGDAEELQTAVDGLAIPGDSWVTDEAVLAQFRAAALLADEPWLGVLPQLLDIAGGHAGVAVSEALARRCIALLVLRFARCEAVDMHEGLLDAALACIGDPLRRRAIWDAYVLEADAKPADHAREMVASWLKHRLIGDFFRLYGSDRDTRRADYWQRFDPFIQALWIGLVKRSLERTGAEHDRYRRRARGMLLGFDELPEDDNALVMRIGDYLVVEFAGGARGMHLFLWRSLDAALVKRLSADRQRRYFNLNELMQTKAEARLEHRDEAANWETRFDARIRPLVWQATRGRAGLAGTRRGTRRV